MIWDQDFYEDILDNAHNVRRRALHFPRFRHRADAWSVPGQWVKSLGRAVLLCLSILLAATRTAPVDAFLTAASSYGFWF